MNRKHLQPIVVLFSLIFTSTYCFGSQTNTGPRFYDIQQNQVTDVPSLVSKLKQKRIILVGEHHTTASHHQAQLEVIRMLNETDVKIAVGLEMFRSDSQKELDRWVSGGTSENEFRGIFYDNWNYDWPLYRDIFLYARSNHIPMVGLNVSREITRQVARGGFQSLNDAQKKKLGDVVCQVDQEYMEFIRRAYGGHGHSNMGFLYFCEAQLVWDNAMAVNSLVYLKANPNRVMVILAGTGHVRKQAIPYQIQRRTNIPFGVILPEVPGSIDSDTVDIEDADYIYLNSNKR